MRLCTRKRVGAGWTSTSPVPSNRISLSLFLFFIHIMIIYQSLPLITNPYQSLPILSLSRSRIHFIIIHQSLPIPTNAVSLSLAFISSSLCSFRKICKIKMGGGGGGGADAVTPGVTHFGAYHRPPNSIFSLHILHIKS